MTDHRSVPDPDAALDAEFERRLRAAFSAASVPAAPEVLHAEASRLVAAPELRARSGVGDRLSLAFAAAVVGLLVVLVGSMLSIGSQPSPDVPAASDASVKPSMPSPSAAAAGACELSPVTVHGSWWREIGGPNAFFNWDGDARMAQSAPWKLFVRFDPDAATTDELSVWAERLDTGERALGAFNSRMDPSNIFRFDTGAPELPGGWYLFEQPLPTPGCWRLTGAIGSQVVGTAVVEVTWDGRPAVPSPTGGPTPTAEATPEPTPWPEQSMSPAADDVLPLAGRNGQPGRLVCANMPITFDALTAPLGAEVRSGPEFDALRTYSVGAPDRDGSMGLGFREVSRDAQNVLFLHEPSQSGVVEAGPYLVVKVTFDGTRWAYAGGGDCQPRGVPGPDFGQATWTLDPTLAAPDAETRTVHLLVQELACSGGRSASGRISPAFVVESKSEVAIELFVQGLTGEGDCPASPPTPATLRLPSPLGDRTLVDVGAIGLGGAGG